MNVRVRWFGLAMLGLVVWLGATFAVAFVVVEWRSDGDEPNFFCQETFRAAVQGRYDTSAEALKNVRLACGDEFQLPGSD